MGKNPNIYAERLLEFPELAFDGERIFDPHGRWRAMFRERVGRRFDGRIIFDVGCADGEALCDIAAKFPGTAFVGLDWKYKSLYLGAARVAKLGLQNVMLLRGRAQDVSRIFSAGEVDETWVFHPEPCDKPAELKNRLVAEPFLVDAHAALRERGSRLCLKTDHPGYYQWTLGLLGLPEPTWFGPAREKTNLPGMPRVKARELVGVENVPRRSDAILSRFDVARTSADFWNDPAIRAGTKDRCFAENVTPFEKRFIGKRLPIYYVELTKK